MAQLQLLIKDDVRNATLFNGLRPYSAADIASGVIVPGQFTAINNSFASIRPADREKWPRKFERRYAQSFHL